MSSVEALSCQELVELVTDYVEGRLPDEDRQKFEEHLAECGSCGNYLDQMRATVELLGRLPREAIPSEAADALLAGFRDWKRA